MRRRTPMCDGAPVDNFLDLNRASWDDRAAAHADSPDYAFEQYVSDPSFLSDVVRFDLPLLGDIGGLRGVHLQCHIGTDTLSLARLGATMSGLDFSGESLAQARRLAQLTDTPIHYVQSEVYKATEVLPAGEFDFVFTGVGALCWLPSIERWAEVVSALLAPGGRLFIREGHPMLWAIDEARTDGVIVGYPYFETTEPLMDEDDGTYVATDAQFTKNVTASWNHGIGETVTALIRHGLRVTGLVEHDSVPWDAMPGQMTKISSSEWQLTDKPERLAHTYTLQATKDSA